MMFFDQPHNSQVRFFSEISGVRPNLQGPAYLESYQKRLLDEWGAEVLGRAARPLIQAARLAVWLEDGGPTIIGLPRVGKGGFIFDQYKIRSMRAGSGIELPVTHTKSRHDPRITNVGGVIRGLSVDELPQFGNVRKGNMSLVGPRPKAPAEFATLCRFDPKFEDAYTSARPGITGLEQVYGRAEASMSARTEFARQYAEEASLSFDLRILAETVRAVISQRGAY